MTGAGLSVSTLLTVTLGLRWPPDTPPLTREPRNMPIPHLDRDIVTGVGVVGVSIIYIHIPLFSVKPP